MIISMRYKTKEKTKCPEASSSAQIKAVHSNYDDEALLNDASDQLDVEESSSMCPSTAGTFTACPLLSRQFWGETFILYSRIESW